MYMEEEKNGSNPWGTPHDKVAASFPTETEEENHSNEVPEMSTRLFSLWIRMWWSTVLNAALRSII